MKVPDEAIEAAASDRPDLSLLALGLACQSAIEGRDDIQQCRACQHPEHLPDECDGIEGYDHLNGDHECGCSLDALLDALAAMVENQPTLKAEALREAADAWLHGEWADAPRCADRVQERIANGQHVGDWLRARADALTSSSPAAVEVAPDDPNQPEESAT